MAEWLKALVLKTSDVERHRGFESLSLRQNSISLQAVEKYPRGRRGSPAKGVGWDNCREGSNPSFSATIPRSRGIFLCVCAEYSAECASGRQDVARILIMHYVEHNSIDDDGN